MTNSNVKDQLIFHETRCVDLKLVECRDSVEKFVLTLDLVSTNALYFLECIKLLYYDITFYIFNLPISCILPLG